MGWSFRKSVSLGGGTRLNFSKSGIGVSTGVKGFRISSGPRGAYVSMGAKGIYYRQKIGGGRSSSHVAAGSRTFPGAHPTYSVPRVGVIPTASADQLVDASSADVLSRINDTIGKPTYMPLVYTLLGVIGFFGLIYAPAAVLIAGILAGPLLYKAQKLETQSRTFPLFYELDTQQETLWNARKAALDSLARTNALWRVEAKVGTWDWKRNAGATQLITRNRTAVIECDPPLVASNVKAKCIGIGGQKLIFLPDRLYVLQGKRYGAISYDALGIEAGSTRFIESDPLPRDAQVVGNTWLYVNKNGSPDRRFNNNRQIPIALYGVLHLSSSSGFNLYFQTSAVTAAQSFASGFAVHNPYGNGTQAPPPRAPKPPSASARTSAASAPSQPKAPQEQWYHGVLGLHAGCTRDEAAAAYRNLAKQYHPDLVAHLAPEFKKIAEERMTMINNAYAELKAANNW